MLTKDYLKGNTYPGRLIAAGVTGKGKVVYAYAIMGRSPNSRNRIFAIVDDRLVTKTFDESRIQDPSLIIYPAMIRNSLEIIVANGDHSLNIKKAVDEGKTMEEAMSERTFEPDEPNYTPRIALLIQHRTMTFAINRRAEDGSCERRSWSYLLEKGKFYMIHTYDNDGDPLPSFSTEPVELEAENDYAPILWEALDSDNRISLFVMEGHRQTIYNAREMEETRNEA